MWDSNNSYSTIPTFFWQSFLTIGWSPTEFGVWVTHMTSQFSPPPVDPGRGQKVKCTCVCVWGGGGLNVSWWVSLDSAPWPLEKASIYRNNPICDDPPPTPKQKNPQFHHTPKNIHFPVNQKSIEIHYFEPPKWSESTYMKISGGGGVSFNFNHSLFQIFYTKLCVYKTYRTGFSFCHLGHALEVGLEVFAVINQIPSVRYAICS